LRPAADATQAEIDQAYTTAATLDALRSVVNPSEAALVAADTEITSPDVILHWTFSAQSITDVLAATRTQNRGFTFTPLVTGFQPTKVADSPLGAADIHVGALEVPYYLTASDTSSSPSVDPTALGSYWQGPGNTHMSYLVGNVTPVATSTEVIPMLVSIPKAVGACASGMPGSGWPVVIFQHGITRTRSDMVAIADAMAGACLAVVAIDMPMHGITGNETDGSQLFRDTVNGERTFDLDLVTQDANGSITAQVPDGVIDTSGRHYINLSNLLNTRDNVRQSASDLFTLVHAIESGAITDTVNMLNENSIYLLGHSLGAIAGTPFLALESSVTDAALAFGGSGIAKILDGSASFGPELAAALLAVAGLEKGTPDYEAFVGAAQTVIDSADPGNHAVDAVSSNNNRGVLFFEIVGDGTPENPSDLVVPNRVPDSNDTSGTVAAPLAGTEPLLSLMGLTQFNSSTTGTDLKVVTKYTSGTHSSLLDPTPNPAVTTEIQTQAANFFASDGAALVVTDSSVLQAPPAP
jgi:pimeloyl-ACP methyl ester carboxylesterase